jgi:hypothetical protein
MLKCHFGKVWTKLKKTLVHLRFEIRQFFTQERQVQNSWPITDSNKYCYSFCSVYSFYSFVLLFFKIHFVLFRLFSSGKQKSFELMHVKEKNALRRSFKIVFSLWLFPIFSVFEFPIFSVYDVRCIFLYDEDEAHFDNFWTEKNFNWNKKSSNNLSYFLP